MYRCTPCIHRSAVHAEQFKRKGAAGGNTEEQAVLTGTTQDVGNTMPIMREHESSHTRNRGLGEFFWALYSDKEIINNIL